MLPGQEMPKAIGTEESQNTVTYERERVTQRKSKRTRPPVKSKEWILAKKERRKRQGKNTAADSKYAARRRPVKV